MRHATDVTYLYVVSSYILYILFKAIYIIYK